MSKVVWHVTMSLDGSEHSFGMIGMCTSSSLW